jgi:hypothetical protein
VRAEDGSDGVGRRDCVELQPNMQAMLDELLDDIFQCALKMVVVCVGCLGSCAILLLTFRLDASDDGFVEAWERTLNQVCGVLSSKLLFSVSFT